jgi:glutathione synthase/RimK-type ligase-like ATP-grasp enzyme
VASLLIVGDPEDLTLVYLSWLAARRGAEVVQLDERRFGLDWSVETNNEHDFAVVSRDGRIDLAGGAAVVARFEPDPAAPAELELSAEQATLLMYERRAAIEFFLNNVPVPVANRPGAGRSNGSKPYQMPQLAASGFEVPPWLITNDVDAADAFVASCPAGSVYKACSGARSQVRRFDELARARLVEGTSPMLLQRYVAGFDVRVHTVGEAVFATKITAPGTDYRFEPEGATYEEHDAREEIGRLCVETTRREGLLIGGLDFRVTKDGRWFCLELNPVPTFLPYEMSTGQPIGDALLDSLFA